MSSRMSKYFDEHNSDTNSRYQKNSDLYKEISKSELDNFSIKSNATIIGDHKNEIDVEKIKQILDTRYNQVPQRKSIRLEEETPKEETKEVTKEYDINVILEKAREQKEDNYDEERMRKLRDTQYDILNNLNVEEKEEDIATEEDNLRHLIDTIALNESKSSNSTNENVDLDILSDLKGDDNTEVLTGFKEEVEEKSKEYDTNMINSFYTTTNVLKESDFEDVDDFSDDIQSNSKFVKIVVVIAILALLIGIGIIIKTVYFS